MTCDYNSHIGMDYNTYEWISNQLECLYTALDKYKREKNWEWVYRTETKIQFYHEKMHDHHCIDEQFEERRARQKDLFSTIDDFLDANPESSAMDIAKACNISYSYALRRKKSKEKEKEL